VEKKITKNMYLILNKKEFPFLFEIRLVSQAKILIFVRNSVPDLGI